MQCKSHSVLRLHVKSSPRKPLTLPFSCVLNQCEGGFIFKRRKNLNRLFFPGLTVHRISAYSLFHSSFFSKVVK